MSGLIRIFASAMDWEAFEKHKAFAGETVPSMLRRRVGHDYEARYVYLVTMTVEGRLPLLGTLVGEADAPDGSPEAPRVVPTALAERGGVLISAAIATREKIVMREAMDKGCRLILLRKNGFPDLYKPSGESFIACSEGRLLKISPWEYQSRRTTISREQCLQLNRMAEFIASVDIMSQDR